MPAQKVDAATGRPYNQLEIMNYSTTTAPEQKRCGCCKKKLCISDFSCAKCQTRYCSMHRLPETHACPHDFMKEGKALLEKRNPRIIGDKIDQI